MFDLSREDIFNLFNLIAEISRQLSLSNPDYSLKVEAYPVDDLRLEAIDLRTGNRYRNAISNFVFIDKNLPLTVIAQNVAMDLCNSLNRERIK